MIEVIHGGLLSSVQDSGRYGHAGIGIGHAGPMDPVCACLANALLDNDANAALIEITLSGPSLRFHADTTIALCGAPLQAQLDGVPLPSWRPVPVRRGSMLRCGGMPCGARAYLAVAGGIALEPVLGSRSTDLNAGFGGLDGRPLQREDILPLGPSSLRIAAAPRWSVAPASWFDPSPQRVLRIIAGTHCPDLDADARRCLVENAFTLGADSNRVGLRLHGPPLALSHPRELVSEATTRGTMQLPPGGQPIVLGAEHPTTGGYPRIAHIIEADFAHLAQRRAGDSLVFQWIETHQARAIQQRQEHALQTLRTHLHHRLREIRCDASM